jgi:hypothetical protein
MKNSNLLSRSLKSISTFIILLAVMFLTGCQKEEMPEMQTTSNNQSTAKITGFTIITIDHLGGEFNQPDYKVEVISDGTVLFTGRKNTAIIGKAKYKVGPETIKNLMGLFSNGRLRNVYEFPYFKNKSAVITTFKESLGVDNITRIDYNGIKPADLIDLRTQAEQILKITKYVSK